MVDGQVQIPLAPGDRVTVRRGTPPFPMVRLPGHNFYRTLRDKLGWGTAPPGDRGREPFEISGTVRTDRREAAMSTNGNRRLAVLVVGGGPTG